jgi:hypothetical protein
MTTITSTTGRTFKLKEINSFLRKHNPAEILILVRNHVDTTLLDARISSDSVYDGMLREYEEWLVESRNASIHAQDFVVSLKQINELLLARGERVLVITFDEDTFYDAKFEVYADYISGWVEA